jgi:hypothetical protein
MVGKFLYVVLAVLLLAILLVITLSVFLLVNPPTTPNTITDTITTTEIATTHQFVSFTINRTSVNAGQSAALTINAPKGALGPYTYDLYALQPNGTEYFFAATSGSTNKTYYTSTFNTSDKTEAGTYYFYGGVIDKNSNALIVSNTVSITIYNPSQSVLLTTNHTSINAGQSVSLTISTVGGIGTYYNYYIYVIYPNTKTPYLYSVSGLRNQTHYTSPFTTFNKTETGIYSLYGEVQDQNGHTAVSNNVNITVNPS